MTKNEIELINTIRTSENPEQSLFVAIKVFSAFLEQLEVTPKPQVAVPQESV